MRNINKLIKLKLELIPNLLKKKGAHGASILPGTRVYVNSVPEALKTPAGVWMCYLAKNLNTIIFIWIVSVSLTDFSKYFLPHFCWEHNQNNFRENFFWLVHITVSKKGFNFYISRRIFLCFFFSYICEFFNFNHGEKPERGILIV